MPNQITKKKVLFIALVALVAAGLACSPFSLSVQPTDDAQEEQSYGVRPTPPPTWTPTQTLTPAPTWTPTPTKPPTATPTSVPTFEACLTPVSSPTILPTLVCSAILPEDLASRVEDVRCEPSDDVLVEAAQDCSPASMTCSVTLKVEGVIVTAKTFYEIQGLEADQCVLSMRVDEMSISYSEQLLCMMIAMLISEGGGQVSEEELLKMILQDEAMLNENAAQMEGKYGVCRFDRTDDLTAWLDVLEESGNYYGASCVVVDGEWRCNECEGALFEGLPAEWWQLLLY